MTDHLGNPLSPPDAAVVVVTSSSSDFSVTRTKYLYIGSAGALVVTMASDGSVVTFPVTSSGQLFPIAVTKVMAATVASGIIALF